MTMGRKGDFERLQSEIQDLIDELWQVPRFSGLRRGFRPQVDVFRTDDPPTVTILVELPGIDPGDIRLVAAQRGVIISGERQRPKNCGQYEQMEIEYGPFQRNVVLGEDIDPEHATATYERGILRVLLPVAPKPPRTQNISIPVRTAP